MLTAKEVIENIEKYWDGGSYQIYDWFVIIYETEEYGWVVEVETDEDGCVSLIDYETLCEIKEFIEWLKGREDE